MGKIRLTMFLGILLVDIAHAETVGTGSFDITIVLSVPPSAISGQIVLDDVTRNVFGTPVNLGIDVGVANIVPPSAVLTYVDAAADYGAFVTVADSAAPGVLSMHTEGEYVCAPDGCASGMPGVFVGTSTALIGTLPATWPSGLVYTSEGSSSCCDGALCVPPQPLYLRVCSGVFALNAFEPANTPASLDPPALPLSGTFYNTLSEQLEAVAADVSFTNVTSGGTTTLTGTSIAAGTIDPSFEIDIGGFNAIFFDVSTTAVYQGAITVCGYYSDADSDGIVDGSSVLETDLVLLHREGNNFVPAWANFVDAAANRVCGSVSSLSPFAIAVSPIGSVPESRADLKCETRLAYANWKLVRNVVKCHAKAVKAAFANRTFDLAACEGEARDKYDETSAELSLSGCPACLAGNAPALGDLLQAVMRIEIAPKTFCSGNTPVGY